MTRDVRVRVAQPADTGKVASLLAAAFAEFEPLYTPEAFRATTPAPAEIHRRLSEGPTWVAELDDRLVGTISAVVRNDGVYVRSMAVAPASRGCGVAVRLLRAVEELALLHDAPRIYLCTTPFLTAAIRLYEAAGFVRTPEHPRDLFGTPLFTMEKTRKKPPARE